MSNMLPIPLEFPSMPAGRPDLLIIAGEHSGDQHAARMVEELTNRRPQLQIAALGGEKLQAAGATLLYDLTQCSVVGIFEVLKNYGFFKRLFEKTLSWIKENRPRHVCFVDYPGFNLELAKKIFQAGLCRKGGGDIGLHYYIGPQIWAWKARRRFNMARWLDSLGVIFPFEVDCYKDTELPVRFVGHPFVTSGFQLPVTYRADGPVLLFPGSRRAAVERIFPVMADAFTRYLQRRPEERALVAYPSENIKEALESVLASRPETRGKIDLAPVSAGVAGKAAITSSGTMSLACGLAGVPGVIAYRAHPLTYLLGSMLIQVPYLGISNLLLEEPIYPEFIQWRARPALLADALEQAAGDPDKIQAARHSAEKLRSHLIGSPDGSAADWLLQGFDEPPGS